ncbi:MAG: exosome complex protein Rrp42 [Candidatus Micrarchaeota archaeon]|nr:exosome complex protein Rrp42 [Candidatus Micrarchaeota archaeon]
MSSDFYELGENYVKKLVSEGTRLDGRGFKEFREIKIETGVVEKAEGSARVTIGNTQVLVGVKMSLGDPYPDTPNEGVLIVNTELVPVASPTFEPGPPDENAIEISRVVDRGIRESKCIELEGLGVGEKVWIINVDIHVLDHDGNLIDASALGAIAALLDAKIPKYDENEEKILYGEPDRKLPVKDVPVAITIGKISGKLLVDTSLKEEAALEARLTVTTNSNGEIVAMQKGGKGAFTPEEIKEAVSISIEKGKEIRKLLGG